MIFINNKQVKVHKLCRGLNQIYGAFCLVIGLAWSVDRQHHQLYAVLSTLCLVAWLWSCYWVFLVALEVYFQSRRDELVKTIRRLGLKDTRK